ncbi:MAG: hypothetical protein KKG47_07665 [Proteobacteria bacterium]|nr:hypothetical protein [Pseudomonadota bacterium]MBU1738393.1 hypothetical protein [Pseudomonadota bacterium]
MNIFEKKYQLSDRLTVYEKFLTGPHPVMVIPFVDSFSVGLIMHPSNLQGFPISALTTGGTLAVFIFSLFLARSGRFTSPWVSALLITLQLLLFRLPFILTNAPLSEDEDVILTFGLNLLRNPVIFDTVEPTSQGLIHAYIAMFVEWFSPVAAYAYSYLHLLSALGCSLCLMLLFLAMKRLFSLPAALAGISLGLLSLVFTDDTDFAHYHNEIESLILLSWAIYLLARISPKTSPPLSSIIIMGVVLGLVPYAKLQGVPLALVLALWALWLIIVGRGEKRRKLMEAGLLALSGLTPTFIIVAVLFKFNLLSDAFFYYIRANWAYGYQFGFLAQVREFLSNMPMQIQISLVIVLAALTVSYKRIRRLPILYLNLMLFLAGWYAISRPGLFFHHYYSYMLPFIVGGGALGYYYLDLDLKRKLFQLAVTSSCLFAMIFSGYDIDQQLHWGWLKKIEQSEAARVISQFASSPDDWLAVWGWYSVLNVETGLPSATRENHSLSLHSPLSPYRDQFEKKYVDDLRRFRPIIFVDSKVMNCGPFVPFQYMPLLNRYIEDNYVFFRTVPGSAYWDLEPVDIYIRKDRVPKKERSF